MHSFYFAQNPPVHGTGTALRALCPVFTVMTPYRPAQFPNRPLLAFVAYFSMAGSFKDFRVNDPRSVLMPQTKITAQILQSAWSKSW